MQTRNGNQSPTVTDPDRKQVEKLAELDKRIALEDNKLTIFNPVGTTSTPGPSANILTNIDSILYIKIPPK